MKDNTGVRRAKRLSLEQLAPYLLDLGALTQSPSPLEWRSVFGNDWPVEVEVGCGKGLFLLTSAQARPNVNFLGIEIVRKLQLFTATRMAKRGLRNVRIAHADAGLLLRDRMASESVQAVHVYFPDPWWKTRHRKRRLFTPDFARECGRVLVEGGRLSIATDVQEYFAVMTEILAQQSKLRPVVLAVEEAPRPVIEHHTNFERKAIERGTAVHRAVYERMPARLDPS